jgi:hypothetical protein
MKPVRARSGAPPALLLLLLVHASPALGDEPQTLRLPITRDTWFSNVGAEADGNNGGAPRLKLKSHQEMSLVDFDPLPLKGRIVRSATLHLRSVGEPRLKRVTVGTFGSEWTEGTASGYAPQDGSSTHNHRRHPNVPWTIPGSDLCSVILGQAGTLWHSADASAPDGKGWQTIAVDPAVVAARVAGVSQGLFLYDDTGSEWTRSGEKFTPIHLPNRFVNSKDSNRANAPFLTVSVGERDAVPPEATGPIRVDPGDLPAGEAWISWTSPRDPGGSGVLGYFVRVDHHDVPRYLIPRAPTAGEPVRMHLRDLGLKPGVNVTVEVRPVDGAGNQGEWSLGKGIVSSRAIATLKAKPPEPVPGAGPLPKLGSAEVAVLDELDKVQPISGAMIPPHPSGYLSSNHLWDAARRRVSLHAARNELIGFQVLIRGGVEGDLSPTLTFAEPGMSGTVVTFSRYENVSTRKGPLPDPLVPWSDRPEKASTGSLKSRSLHCELTIPHDAPVGLHAGTLMLRSGGQSLEITVSLQVWDFTLPDLLSFLPEMNCYGLPEKEREYYRLAHRNRTVLNRVPYSQNGTMAEGCAPVLKNKTLDWRAWDQRFGPYFDGSAFRDLPRKNVPIECFYLPLHENWPDPIEGSYNGDYWADRAFPESYRRDFVDASRQVAQHLNEKKWNDTLFQFFLNGKNDFKVRGWSRGSSPWLLDEPSSFQDFWALRYFGRAFHEGVDTVPGKAKLVFRCDISRPQWQRDTLDGLLDYNVVGGAMRSYRRIVMDRKAANGEIVVEYGSSNAVEESNLQAVGWSLDSWSLGSDGVLPWQTVGTAESWKSADTLALFYPPRPSRDSGPIPSIRLLAYRRGQQDVEYLTLLSRVLGEPRWAIGGLVREALHLRAERTGSGVAAIEDAGVISFRDLQPQELWSLRLRVGQTLSSARPEPRARLVDLRTPRRLLTGRQ